MPILSLPIEIVHEIAFHLRAPPFAGCYQAIEDGQSLSLVCRRWYSTGQALRWRHLRIDITSVPSLLAHFDRHHHLPRLVRSLEQRSYADDIDADFEGFENLPSLLDMVVEVRHLHLSQRDSTFEAVSRSAADLTRLVHLYVSSTNQGLTWNSNINSIFAQGFPSLRQLLLSPTSITVDAHPDTIPEHDNLKQIENLYLDWNTSNSPNQVESVLASLDPATLQFCVLSSPSYYTLSSSSDWLARCTNLRDLQLFGDGQFLTSNFPTLLASLPHMTSLGTLNVGFDSRCNLRLASP